jgi:hypothetical protein
VGTAVRIREASWGLMDISKGRNDRGRECDKRKEGKSEREKKK